MPESAPADDPLFGNPASDLIRGALEGAPGATPSSPWEPPTPKHLADLLPQYEIERMLGRGGMGAVYKGRQISLDRPVAIKILSSHLAGVDASFIERFKNEARAMAKLSHPGIVAVYDFGEAAGGLLYIVMEFVEGTDVGAMIARQGRLHSEHAMAITAHVCDALAYAHERGIIHRDIKPANIMLRDDGVVKVADFGLAKFSTNTGETLGLTQSGMAMGTLHYMAPEALMLGAGVDHRADIYAVGVMLYQMLTGKLPQGLFELPSLQIPGLDPRYDGIIGRALREDREVRYPKVLDMRRDLDAILTQPVVKVEATDEKAPAALPTQVRSQRSPGQPYRPPVSLPRPAPRTKSSSSGLVAVVLLAVTGAAVFYFLNLNRGQTVSPVGLPADAGEWRDLLALVDPKAGTVSGKWSRIADGLQGERFPDGKGAQVLQLPYEPPEEYDFRVSYTTLDGNAEISQILSAAGRQFTWGTASGQPEKWAGFNMIKGKPMMQSGAGVKLPTRRELNRRYESLVEVRRDRVTGYVDGEMLVEWKTDYSDLSADPAHVMPNSRALGIGIWWSKTVFHEISVREVTGNGKLLRTPDAAPVTTEVTAGPSTADPDQATKDQPFVNSLGMKFVPVPGTTILMCIHETRRKDYTAYLGANPSVKSTMTGVQHDGIDVGSTDLHPVCNLTWDQAQAFCAWLSKKDGREYRLPTDREWSWAVGIGDKEDPGTPPSALVARLHGEYPWGTSWPPPPKSGNFSDASAAELLNTKAIPGYHDGFGGLAPVMSFPPNALGVYDLAGNVWEWCSDWYDASKQTHVLRGGCYRDGGLDNGNYLRSASRVSRPLQSRSAADGFRVVMDSGSRGSKSTPPRPTTAVTAKAELVSATKDKPFVNSLGMQFVPVPDTEVLFCIHETRKADYAAYAAGNAAVDASWKNPDLRGIPVSSGDDHPVCNVSWDDAKAFCDWLGKKEGFSYRLPTDREWSTAVGIAANEPAGKTPVELQLMQLRSGVYPWGTEWPPPQGSGNFSDATAKQVFPLETLASFIEGYSDSWAGTAPVMSFKPNKLGLFDLAGNVYEMCEDWTDESRQHRVVRGHSWNGGTAQALLSSNRGSHAPAARIIRHGFRVVLSLATKPQATDAAASTLPSSTAAPALPTEPTTWTDTKGRSLNATFKTITGGNVLLDIAGKISPVPLNTLSTESQKLAQELDAALRLAEVGDPAKAAKDKPFVNTLGMKFVPVPIKGGPTGGKRMLFSIWETRVQDYNAFVQATMRTWSSPEFTQGPTHPAVMVSWTDARAFAGWLTARERQERKLPTGAIYRLPTDHEWSCAAGIGDREQADLIPEQKYQKLPSIYPWEKEWPPPSGSGNFWSEELRPMVGQPGFNHFKGELPGYKDGAAATSPVGSYPPNRFGLYDLGGNVWEWCEDWFNPQQRYKVQRGGSWNSNSVDAMLSSHRHTRPPQEAPNGVGFRLVLDVEGEPTR